MSFDPKRSILAELKKPLYQSSVTSPSALEEKLLGRDPESGPSTVAAPAVNEATTALVDVEQRNSRRPLKNRVPTVPVTFHLPVDLRDRLKITAQANQRTMLDVAMEALTEYLDHHALSESDIRRFLRLI